MSEALTAELNTPEAAAAEPGAASEAAAAPAAAADATLNTPEPVEGEEAAASDQGAGEGDTGDAGKSEGEKPAGEKEGEAEPSGGDDTQGAPEAYADFTMPEGFQLPAEFGSELTALAKELNLPQATAQKLVDLGVKHAQAVQTTMAETLTTAKAQWADQARNDAEYGGHLFGPNMAVAKKAMVTFGSPALAGVLNQTGLSQHPEILRLLVRVGAAISEDTLVAGDGDGGGGGGRPAVRDHAKRLYPKQN